MNISRVRNKIFCSVKCIFREEIKSSIVNSSICKSWYHHETSNAIFLFFVLGCECVNYSMIKDDLIHTCICVTLTVCVSVCKHLQKSIHIYIPMSVYVILYEMIAYYWPVGDLVWLCQQEQAHTVLFHLTPFLTTFCHVFVSHLLWVTYIYHACINSSCPACHCYNWAAQDWVHSPQLWYFRAAWYVTWSCFPLIWEKPSLCKLSMYCSHCSKWGWMYGCITWTFWECWRWCSY